MFKSKDPQVKMRIEQYFLMTDYSLWEVILNGDSPISTRVVDGVVQPIAPTTTEQRLAKKNELKARGTLLMDLPNKHQLKFNIHKDAKSLMEAIEKRLQKLISQLEILDESLSQEDINMKLFRSLPLEWRTYTLIWRNKADLEDQSLDDLFNNLKIYEAEIKSSSSTSHNPQNVAFVSFQNTNSTNESLSVVASVSAASTKPPASILPNVDNLSDALIYSFFSSQSNSPQLDNDDLKQIRTGRNLGPNGTTSIGFDMSKVECYRRGHFARECRSPKATRNKDTQRRSVLVETSTFNALVSQCDGVGSYDWSFQVDEEPTNYALMVFTSSSSTSSLGSDSQVALCSKACTKAYATLQSHYDKLTVDFRKSQFDVLLYKSGLESVKARLVVYQQNENVFEEDIKLLKLDVMLRDNALVELRKKFKNAKKEKDNTVFDNDELTSSELDESVPTSPVHDRYKSGEWYHAVPPPYTGIFMPPKPDLVFHDAFTISETVSTVINVEPSSTNPNKDLSQSNRPSAPIIEDWVSDSEDEYEGEPMPIQKAPSFVQTSKHVKTPRTSVKPVDHPKQAEYLKKDIPKSRGHKHTWNRNACFVCKSVNHFIKDYDYYKKKMVQKHVWNHAMRVNHQNSARMTHPHSKKHVVPTAVLTRSRLVPLDATRLVTTIVPQTIVKHQRPAKHVVNNPHSPIRRPINHRPAPKTSNFHQKVTNVKPKKETDSDDDSVFTPEPIPAKIDFVKASESVKHVKPIESVKHAEAVNTACYVLNRALVTKTHNKIPYELFNGRTPSLDFIRPFGCPVTILNTLDPLGKFKGKADKGFLVGYSVTSKAFRVFNTKTKKLKRICMLGNQTDKNAGPQDTNGNVGTQDNVDAGKEMSDKNYIMFPLWSFISSTFKSSDDKAIDDKPTDDTSSKTVEEPVNKEDQAYRDELDRLMRQEKEAGTFSAAGPSSPHPDAFIPANTLLHVDKDDSQIPNLEETAKLQKAEFNNMESSTIVSHIPIHKVHIDHPKDQILGDLKSAVQTKGMEKKSSGARALMEPKKVSQALDDESWVEAMQEELLQFSLQKDKDDIMLVQVYVDDIIFGSTKKSLCDEFEALMHKRFQMSSMGELTFFLGLQLKQNEEGIFIIQDKFQATLKLSHLQAMKRIFRRLISWQCKKQTIVATSTTEAEYVAAAHCYLKFVDQHNMVACLEKTEANAEFHQIVYFLSTCSINYVLTVSPTIYASYIENFWNTAISKIVNLVKQIHAIVTGKDVVILESSVRSDLLFNDEDGRLLSYALGVENHYMVFHLVDGVRTSGVEMIYEMNFVRYVLLLAWDRVFEIKDAFGNKQYKPEDIQELFRKNFNDVQNIHEELAEYINTPSWNRPVFYKNDEDNDEDYTIAITPDFLITDSLSMGDEHLSTIPETESDELIKSSVENLIPNPCESEDLSNIGRRFEGNLFEPSFDEEIISTKIDPHHFNAESDLIEFLLNRDTSIVSSPKFDSLLEEFSSELAHIDLISPEINETDFDPEEEILFVERLLYDNSSPRPPEEFNSRNSDAIIEFFSPSPVLVEGSDSLMEEIGIFLTPDDSMPPGIENDDYDSEEDILFLEELLSNDSPSLPENESFHFDIPSSPRPLTKPPDDDGIYFDPDTVLLTTKAVGDISEQYVLLPRLLPTQPTICLVIDTLLSFSFKNKDKVHLLSHRGFKAF
nr:ribonuclease H-like domain-containing protein [Tanacetum cinerariifolium]